MRKLFVSLLVGFFAVTMVLAGEYQSESKEYEKAFKSRMYAAAVKLAKTSVGKGNALNARGYAVLREGKYKEAKKLFEAAIKADPEQYWAYNSLGTVLLALGDKKGAIDMFKKHIAVNKEATDPGADDRIAKGMKNLEAVSR